MRASLNPSYCITRRICAPGLKDSNERGVISCYQTNIRSTRDWVFFWDSKATESALRPHTGFLGPSETGPPAHVLNGVWVPSLGCPSNDRAASTYSNSLSKRPTSHPGQFWSLSLLHASSSPLHHTTNTTSVFHPYHLNIGHFYKKKIFILRPLSRCAGAWGGD